MKGNQAVSGSIDRKKLLFYGLAALPGILAFFTLADLVAGEGPVARKRKLFVPIRFKKEASRPVVKEDDYLTIQANRFCGASSPWTPRRGKARTGYQAVYLLRGTAIHSDPSRSLAFIEVPGVDGQKAYHVGDDVHGAVLSEIRPDSVILKRGEETIELDLSYEDLTTGRRERAGTAGRPKASPGGIESLPRDQVQALLRGMPSVRRRKIMSLPPAQRLRVLRNLLRKSRREGRNGENRGRWKAKVRGGKRKKPRRRDAGSGGW